MIPGSANPLLLRSAAPTAYQVSRSLRFNGSVDSSYLSRTPGSAGNRKTWTWSGWVKRSGLGTMQMLLSAWSGFATELTLLQFTSDDTLIYYFDNAANNYRFTTAQVFRDCSSWYHLLLAVDTTQAVNTNRAKLYVNGSQVTAFSQYDTFPPSSNTFINSTFTHNVGRYVYDGTRYFSGYLADIHLIDGQALTPSSFGEFDTNNVWQPKAYSGSYGTNGFHLDFADNSAATAAALGKDTSGNGNNWTPNNLSVTAGAGNDSTVDSPTNGTASSGGDAGGVTVGNYCTLNPTIAPSNRAALSNGNLDFTAIDSTSTRGVIGTFYVSSGKWYWESVINTAAGTSAFAYGVVNDAGTSYVYYALTGDKYIGVSASSYGATWTTGDTIGTALDMDAGTVTFYKNGVSQGTAFSGLTGSFAPRGTANGGTDYTGTFNFGQRPFAYTAPSGFKALNTANLPTPTIAKGSDYFDVKLYTGNGSTQTISGLNFSPDLVWVKIRSGVYAHHLADTVRGASKHIWSNLTDAEYNYSPNGISAFNSNGFDLTGAFEGNYSGQSYVAWCWDAGANSSKTYTVTVVSGAFYIDGKQKPTLNLEEGSTYTFDLSAASNSGHPFRLSTSANGPTEYTTGVTTSGTAGNAGATLTIAVASGAPTLYYFCTNHSGMGEQINTNTTAGASNFAGSITSSVRANASAGFSIVTYTGNGSSTDVTIGHGLGVAPQLVIVKSRGSASNGNWRVGHSSLATNNNLLLNTTDAQFSATSIAAGGGVATSHSSTTITLKAGPGGGGFNPTDYVNQNTITYVAYCFAPVAGYSSFGSYTGNGSADGPFVFCNFRPRWILIKNTSTTADWCLFDTARDTYNQALGLLNPNLSNAENILGSGLDILSNGFKLRRDASPAINNSANTFVYAAFAESPFAYARAR